VLIWFSFLVLSLDVMDISGEHQSDLEHDISKTRLDKDGRELETTKSGRQCWHMYLVDGTDI
jgi:hypothetical protein